jgi:esterase/lipase superfamily enzyme
MRWLITNRNIEPTGFGTDQDQLTYWTLKQPGLPLDNIASWSWQSFDSFKQMLVSVADQFPTPYGLPPEEQKHICLFIHGYNNDWTSAMSTYGSVAETLFDGPNSMGELISFDWPSKGSLLGYLPDRAEARQTGDDLTEVLSELYDWLAAKQLATKQDTANACKAKTSVIAHSMGNYALQYAMEATWTRKNRPLLVSLLQEVLMVAADVDNDIFKSGENISDGDGEGLANMSYRITALYTGRDNVLGSSAGLKHFGKRRLGRSGLDRTYPVPDNVWDIDCSNIIDANVSGMAIHGEYFNPQEQKCYALMRGGAGRKRPQRSDRKRAGAGVDSEAAGGYFGGVGSVRTQRHREMAICGGGLGIAADEALRYDFQKGEGPSHCMS